MSAIIRCIKLLYIFVLCAIYISQAHPIFSVDKKTKIIAKGDFVFDIQRKFPDVYTKGEAKSKETLCSFRIDLINGLVSTGGCDIYRVDAFTKEAMWMGTLTYIGGLSNITSFDSRTNYNHTWFNGAAVANPYDIWGIKVEFVEPTEIADSSNISAVSCPSGQKLIIVEDEEKNGLFYWDCYIPWKCQKNEYSVNEQTCEVLPENAHRNPKGGYVCNEGFVHINYSCEKKKICNETEHYDEVSNVCWNLPQNAKWADNVSTKNDFVCDSGFVKNIRYSTCDEKLTCEENQHYDMNTNTCWSLPPNAYWKENVSDSLDWNCQDGYVSVWYGRQNAYRTCEKKELCDSKDFYDKSSNSCWILPKNAHWDDGVISETDWSCNQGYLKKNNRCKKIMVCGEKEILNDNGDCEAIPKNAHKVNSKDWMCDTGYELVEYEAKSSCKKRKKSESTSIPTTWITTGASIILGIILIFVSINAGK